MEINEKFIEECTGACDWDSLIFERFNQIVPEDSIIADIGANVGAFTFRIEKEKKFKEIYAIEADKENFKILKNESTIDSNVKLINVAVADYVGKISLYEGTGTCETRNILGNDSLQENFNLKHIKRDEVNCATLDHIFLDKIKVQIDACKLDVEGAEVLVIEGAKKLINNMKCLFIECHNNKTFKDILALSFENNWMIKCLKNLYTIKTPEDLDFCYQIILFPNPSKFSG